MAIEDQPDGLFLFLFFLSFYFFMGEKAACAHKEGEAQSEREKQTSC